MRRLLLLLLTSCQAILGIDPGVTIDGGSDARDVAIETAICTMTTCTGACVDLQTDPLHCGDCAKSCDGAPCMAGVCQPLVLADEETGVTCVRAIDKKIFFGVGGNFSNPTIGDLYSIPRDGSETKTKIAFTGFCNELDWDGSTLVVHTPNDLIRMKLDGSQKKTLYTNSNIRTIFDHKGELWWFERHKGLFHMPRAGGAVVGPIDPTPADNGSPLLFILDPYIYFGDDTADLFLRQPLAGPPTDTLGKPASLVSGALGDNNTIWFTDGTTLCTYRETDGIKVVAQGIVNARDVVYAGDDVYVAAVDPGFGLADGSIYRYRQSTKSLSVFVPAVLYPNELAADDRYLYYTVLIGGKGSGHRKLVRVER